MFSVLFDVLCRYYTITIYSICRAGADRCEVGRGGERAIAMASGIGINGGTGRCYGLWIDFTKCLSTFEACGASQRFDWNQ